jgi:hypothetical protein
MTKISKFYWEKTVFNTDKIPSSIKMVSFSQGINYHLISGLLCKVTRPVFKINIEHSLYKMCFYYTTLAFWVIEHQFVFLVAVAFRLSWCALAGKR